MAITFPGSTFLSGNDFLADATGARYADVVDRDPEAFARTLMILNQPEMESRLVEVAEREPALAAAVRALEEDVVVTTALEQPEKRHRDRFKRMVGVAVRLKMERLGWQKATGQGSMARYSRHFGTARRYERATDAISYRERALAGLAEMRKIGTEEERQRDREELMAALAETRRLEGRPF